VPLEPTPRADAYLGQKAYRKVLDELESGTLSDPMTSTARALALLKLGRTSEARKHYQDQFIARQLPSMSYLNLPPKKTDREFEGTLWLARGINAFVAGSAKRAEHDLFESNRLVPNQPLTSYFIGKLYLQFGKKDDARKYLKIAAKLPGALGKDAERAAR
jgi:Flp pilus assembly protein TadD